jgi:hypothetical protein
MSDRQPGRIGRRLSRRDESPDADTVQVYLDPRHDGRSGALFEVSAGGVQRDALIFNDSQLDFSWDAVWDSAVAVDERGWSVELRIPFSQLRFSSENAGVWGINVARYIRRNNESDWLTAVPKRETHLAARMADLVGLAAVRPAPPNEVVAHAVTRSAAGVSLGADMKRGLGSDLILEATVNPDFSQVEGDPAAINLTAFETFLAERRPFFTESAPLFQTFGNSGGAFDAGAPTLFYSRRIGQAPADVIDVGSVDEPDATPVLGAMKLAGSAGPWKLALLDALGASTQARSTLDVTASPVEVAPSANFAAGRLFRDTNRGGVGLLGTAVHRRMSAASAPTSFVPERALVGGVDGYVFFDRDQQWVVGGQISGSHLSWTSVAAAPELTTAPAAAAVAKYRAALSDTRNVQPPGRGGGPPTDKPGNGPPTDNPGHGPPSTPPGAGGSNGRGNGPPSTVPGNGPPSTVPGNGPPAGASTGAMTPVLGPAAGGGEAGTVNTGPNRVLDLAAGHLGGWSANANVHRNSGDVRVNVDAWAIDPGFETNDLGFLPRADIQGLQGHVSWSKFDPDAVTRFRSVDVSKGWTRTFAGEKQSDTFDVSSSAVFLNYWSAGSGVSVWREAFDATATRGGPSVRTPPGRSWWAWASTDGRHMLSLDVSAYHSSTDANDASTNAWIGATLKPSPRVSLSVGPSFDHQVVNAQYVETVQADATPHYVFATLRADDVGVTARVNAIATARLSFQAYFQSLVATGRYTGFQELAAPGTDRFVPFGADAVGNPDFDPALFNLHAVVRWEWQRGSTLYLVWTQRRFVSTGAATAGASQLLQPFDGAAANAVMAKVTYWVGR